MALAIPYPGHIVPRAQPWNLEQNVFGHVSEYDLSSDYAERIGSRWQCELDLPLKRDRDRIALGSFLARLKGPASVFWLGDMQNRRLSTEFNDLQVKNHIADPWPNRNADDWSSIQNVEINARSSGWIEVTKLNVAGGGGANEWIAALEFDKESTNNSNWHHFSFYFDRGSMANFDAVPIEVRMLDDAAAELFAWTPVIEGRNIISFNFGGTPSTQTGTIEFRGNGLEPQDTRFFVTGFNLSRVFRTLGSLTGNNIVIQSLFNLGDNRIRAGSMVELGGRLYRIRHDVDTNPGAANATGLMIVDPPVYTAVPSGTPVILTEPVGLFQIAEGRGWDQAPGLSKEFDDMRGFSNFAFACSEDSTRLNEVLSVSEIESIGSPITVRKI